jgi:uncharacterized protein YdhG (YjbR/CyaY superfamily)
MPNAPKSVNEYLRHLTPEKRTTLQKIRQIIKAVVPAAEERISYHVPTLWLDGKMLISFGAGANHCAIYPGAYPVRVLAKELEGYDTSKGTIRFPIGKPLPATLVRKVIKARLEERTVRRTRVGKKAKSTSRQASR